MDLGLISGGQLQYLRASMIDTFVELFEETDVEERPRRASIQLLTEILTNKRGISAKWTPRLLGHSPVWYKSRGWKVQGVRLARDTTEHPSKRHDPCFFFITYPSSR